MQVVNEHFLPAWIYTHPYPIISGAINGYWPSQWWIIRYPPLDAQKGQKLSGFAVQPVISTRSGFLLSGFHTRLNLFSTLIQGSGKESNSNTVHRCGVTPAVMAGVRLRYHLGVCLPMRARGWDSFTLRLS
jgi:hypothetical protein